MTEETTPPDDRHTTDKAPYANTARSRTRRSKTKTPVVRIVDDALDPQGWGRIGKLKNVFHPMGQSDDLIQRLTRVYPWMFEGPNWGLQLPQRWFGVFCQLCAEIDQALGNDRMGFRWTDLHQEDGKACWQFVWGQDYWLRIAVYVHDGKLQVQQYPPDGDRRLAKQKYIRMLVNRSITLANLVRIA